MKHTLIILTLILLSYQAFPQNTQITSFSKSKKLLLKLYKDNPVTLYCGCSYKGKKPNLSSCGYIPKKNKKRANRIEWEHVVPAHAFGQTFSEWRKGHPKCVKKNGKKFKGRKCAEKVNKQYRRMQADMFNLYPASGEVNGRRSLIALGQSSNVVKMFPLFMDHLGVPRNHISQLMGHEDSNMALDESSSGLAIEPLVESINKFTYGKEIDSFIKSNEA